MAGRADNELLSTQKSSDLQVALHPLPILEISDFIARGYQRGFKGAVVGALLGQQHGREVTIEHSFSCKSIKNADGHYELDQEWFRHRLDQMKLVHKSPPLDLVGWYALVPKAGPTALHLPIHRQISAVNESAVLLGFHVEDILSPTAGDPLPITIYESNMEAQDSARDAEGEDKEMRDAEVPAKMVLRFRKLPYTTETGEAEMIAMQFIREGGANAMVDTTERHILEQFDKKIAVDDGKGKRRAVAYDESKQPRKEPATASAAAEQPEQTASPDANLTRAEAEYMSALQAKYNAIKMMKSRVSLIITYLQRLQSPDPSGVAPSNTILRHIQALVTNLDLVAPAEQATLEHEIQRETNDVHLVSLISDLVSSVNQVREAGKKFSVLELSRHGRQGRGGGPGAAGFDPGFMPLGHLSGEVVHGGGAGGDAVAGEGVLKAAPTTGW
ncbi:COP9 signalosome complex subunit 6 [Madurella mycetomatis]|uniref:COP9 signalosome complex subunit 6 n=1 Tax=Madurella mycetomatis TaxID=100816 RepID=A0A175W9P2_9PEZI|nr:COP9 signalosome complex subunit 6 [Madurella mycetomatis]